MLIAVTAFLLVLLSVPHPPPCTPAGEHTSGALAAAVASVEALKTQGNRAFLASRFLEALFRYTDAVQVALASQLGCVFRWLSVSLATEIGL